MYKTLLIILFCAIFVNAQEYLALCQIHRSILNTPTGAVFATSYATKSFDNFGITSLDPSQLSAPIAPYPSCSLNVTTTSTYTIYTLCYHDFTPLCIFYQSDQNITAGTCSENTDSLNQCGDFLVSYASESSTSTPSPGPSIPTWLIIVIVVIILFCAIGLYFSFRIIRKTWFAVKTVADGA